MTEDSAALRDLEERLSQEPDNLPLRVRMAAQLREQGRTNEATELLRAVAVAYRDQANYERALAIGQTALELAPADEELRAMVEELSARDDEVTATGASTRREGEQTLVDPREPAARAASRARSASIAALISQPRGLTRPPPLRTRFGPTSASGTFSEDTPLPAALPYHIADPSTPASKAPYGVRGVHTDPSKVTGLAEAARRISGLITHEAEDPLLDAEMPSNIVSPVVLVDDPPPQFAIEPSADDGRQERASPHHTSAIEPSANLFFAALSEAERSVAVQRFERRKVHSGAIVIRQGALSHPLVAVLQGRLELRLERPNCADTILDSIEIGQHIGEAALLGRSPAPANIIAAAESELLFLPANALFELAGAFPSLWAALKDTAERRTRRYDQIIRALP